MLGLYSRFQAETRLCFVMEYAGGVDLMLHMQRKQLSLRQGRCYASEALLTLLYFYTNRIVHHIVSDRLT